jgi:hypothetical protein
VLDTTELLECVLSHLPPKQIFGVQRVARLWKDVIARSLGMKEKMFLKLQNKPAEVWALLECARSAQFESRKLRLEKITSEPDLKFISATDATLFTPVSSNPFLQLGEDPVEGPLCDRRISDRAHLFTPEITEFRYGLGFDLNSSLLNTYISDPPCIRARVALSYYSTPERTDCYRLQACFVVQTGKPLTLRDVIAETWTDAKWIDQMTSAKIYNDYGWSNQDEVCNPEPEPEYDENDEILERASLADIIERLEIKHDCKAVFKPEHTVITLDNNGETSSGPFSLVPTEAERQDVVAHDKDAYAALMVAIDADKKEWEAAWKRMPKMTLKDLEALHRFDQ